MQKLIVITGGLLLFFFSGVAQPRPLHAVIRLQMPDLPDDANTGYYGASVCWNPLTRLYYAGNTGGPQLPFAVFDEKGRVISHAGLSTQTDIRGLWYNPRSRQIEGNMYNDGGWFSYRLDKKGLPDTFKIMMKGMHQPDENSAGALDPDKQQVFFLDKAQVVYYDLKTGKRLHQLSLHLGRPQVLGADPNDNPENEPLHYNITSVGQSGIATAPIAVLNVRENRIELYDDTQGFLRQILLLPEDVSPTRRYNFACSNHTFWIFDPDKRCWTGYR